jgi:hypothetical protein
MHASQASTIIPSFLASQSTSASPLLSTLHSDLLCLVLSFLPTREMLLHVARTSRQLYQLILERPDAWRVLKCRGKATDVELPFSVVSRLLPLLTCANIIHLPECNRFNSDTVVCIESFLQRNDAQLPHLRDLSLASCHWLRADTLRLLIRCAPNIMHLNLNNTHDIESSVLVEDVLCNSHLQLQYLNLGNQSTILSSLIAQKRLPHHCVALRSLIELHLSFSVTVSDVIVHFLCESASDRKLQVLNLSSCVRVTSAALQTSVAEHCPQLKSLLLTRCDGIDHVPANLIAKCNQLQILALPHRCATSQTLNLLKRLPKLERLTIAFGARSLADQFSSESLMHFLSNTSVLVELHVCRIVHAQLAADVLEMQNQLGSNRIVNLHDCAEHGGFVGSSRGPLALRA